MDIGNVKPVMAGITTPVPRAPAQGEQATETDLPVRSAVTEASGSDNANVGSSTSNPSKTMEAAAANAARHAVEHAERLDSRFEIDQSTRELIFQKVNTQTGDVVAQQPEEWALRMHALIQAFEDSSSKSAATVDQSV